MKIWQSFSCSFYGTRQWFLDGIDSTSEVSAMSYLLNQFTAFLKNIEWHSDDQGMCLNWRCWKEKTNPTRENLFMRCMGEMIQKTKPLPCKLLKRDFPSRGTFSSAAFSCINGKVSMNNGLLLRGLRNQVEPAATLLLRWNEQHEKPRPKPHPGSAGMAFAQEQQGSCPCSCMLVFLKHSPGMWRLNEMAWIWWILYQTFFSGVLRVLHIWLMRGVCRWVLPPLPFLDLVKGFGFILVWSRNTFLIAKIFWDKETISCPALQ